MEEIKHFPLIDVSLVLFEMKDNTKCVLLEELERQGIEYCSGEQDEIILSETRTEQCWDIADAITIMFEKCKTVIPLLSSLVKDGTIRVLLDIAFYHEYKYPSLVFEGDNMTLIRDLQADISIDPY